MRRFILCVLLVTGSFINLHSQDSVAPPNRDTSINAYISPDSLAKKQSMDQMNQNLNRFVKDMQARDKKAKKEAMIRIGIGVLFLGVLVVGILRRRKKKTTA